MTLSLEQLTERLLALEAKVAEADKAKTKPKEARPKKAESRAK